jgi:hypothetical protein
MKPVNGWIPQELKARLEKIINREMDEAIYGA